jgi:hypothetical protein
LPVLAISTPSMTAFLVAALALLQEFQKVVLPVKKGFF